MEQCEWHAFRYTHCESFVKRINSFLLRHVLRHLKGGGETIAINRDSRIPIRRVHLHSSFQSFNGVTEGGSKYDGERRDPETIEELVPEADSVKDVKNNLLIVPNEHMSGFEARE